MMRRRLRPVSVKRFSWKKVVPRPKDDPVFYINVVLDFLLFTVPPAISAFGFHVALLKQLAISTVLAALGWLIYLRVDSWEWLRVSLEPPESRCLTKRMFERAPFPKRWYNQRCLSEYFILQLKLSGIPLLSYPGRSKSADSSDVPAHEVFSFLDARSIRFHPRSAHRSYFVQRCQQDGEDWDPNNQFSKDEISEYGRRTGRRLDNNPAVWITGLNKDQGAVILSYDKRVTYFQCYVLCNESWFQERKFPRETEYPFYLTQRHISSFGIFNEKTKADGLYGFLADNPSILGVEVIFVTKDGKIVLQLRSGGTAINRNTIVPSVSAGYEPTDFMDDSGSGTVADVVIKGAFREAKRELGVDPREHVDRCAILGLVHILPSNELNFVVLMESSLTSSVFIQRLRSLIRDVDKGNEEKLAVEHWEFWKLLLVNANQVTNFDGEWKEYFERKSHKLERCIYPLHFWQLAAENPDKIPWRDGKEVVRSD